MKFSWDNLRSVLVLLVTIIGAVLVYVGKMTTLQLPGFVGAISAALAVSGKPAGE